MEELVEELSARKKVLQGIDRNRCGREYQKAWEAVRESETRLKDQLIPKLIDLPAIEWQTVGDRYHTEYDGHGIEVSNRPHVFKRWVHHEFNPDPDPPQGWYMNTTHYDLLLWEGTDFSKPPLDNLSHNNLEFIDGQVKGLYNSISNKLDQGHNDGVEDETGNLARKMKRVDAEKWIRSEDKYSAFLPPFLMEVEKDGEIYRTAAYHVKTTDCVKGTSVREEFASITGKKAKEIFDYVSRKADEYKREAQRQRLELEKEERRKEDEWKKVRLKRFLRDFLKEGD